MIKVSEYIASENLPGVQQLAQSLNYSIPKTMLEAVNFLSALYQNDSNYGKEVFKSLHPDATWLTVPSFANMMQAPIEGSPAGTVNTPPCSACMHNAMENNLTAQLQQYADTGVKYTKDLVKESYQQIKEIIQERDNQVFKRHAIFIGGITVGILGTIVAVKLFKK